jgi:hypothetical protein
VGRGAQGSWLRWLPLPVGIGLAVVGWGVLTTTLSSSGSGHVHATSYESNGFELSVEQSVWMSNDMYGGPMPTYAANFPMPQQMMPGLQTSDNNRLHVEVSLRNQTGDGRSYGPDDFHLVSQSGGDWKVNDGSFDPGTLAPGYAVSIDLYFDVPTTDKGPLSVVWQLGGYPVQIPIVVGQAPAHNHGP